MIKFGPHRQVASGGLPYIISLTHQILTGIKLTTVKWARDVTQVGKMKNMHTVLVGLKESTVEIGYDVTKGID